MYTISRGPSKLVTQRRTGPTQPLENKTNDFKHKQTSWNLPDLPAPKIVFTRLSGKKNLQPASARPADLQPDPGFSAAHEENVNFIYEAWQEVQQQEQGPEGAQRVVHYKETNPSPHVDTFVPIDLDEWWAQRFLANIDKLS
ncbi:MAPK regulated corepressor interacting protein 2-like [Acanthochromis polyacanthus]|uniref:MAPK regulated corepressor interacting protein 2-like n=1 Tax=Acanthochromis polyacanthus TaxID=80966 RepID=A0A3Q1FEA6_9TELE|nr:MAPK regulated corepressor interacting protein 2-like [Acanthochromis polyacanthus]